ncbi:MAG: 4Fe-4S dicluster domain-containing protein [Candidatus Thorarchaeota archaeon]|jgi:Fe-S-cluster-containing hydrogenase component 2
MEELKFIIGDPHVCTGCMICVNTCSMNYYKVIGPSRSRARAVRIEPGLDFSVFCRNCEDPYCLNACPNEAISRTSKGIVIVNSRKCDGTGECVKACPYFAIRIHPDTGKAFKCIQCERCVDRCPTGAIFATTTKGLEKRDPERRILGFHDEYSEDLYGEEAKL